MILDKRSLLRGLICYALLAGAGQVAADEPVAEPESVEEADDMEPLTVLGSRKANYTEITESTEKLVVMPGALGDPLGAITALPGVISPAGGGAPAVRGSSPADNRYFIDGIPAGYIFHQFNTSILDENVIQDFQLFTAGFGAEYAGATGAIFDVRLRDPRPTDFETTVSLSLLRAGVFLESRVTDDSAFYLSVREGLIQYFVPKDDEPNDEGIRIVSPPEDRDYQGKYVYHLNPYNSLSLLLTGAQDFAEAEFNDDANFVAANPDFAGDALLKSSFNSQGVTWKRSGGNRVDSWLSVATYENKERFEFGDDYFSRNTLNNELLKGQIQFPLSASHTVSLGFEYNDYSFDYSARLVLFVCTEFDVDCQEGRGDVVEDQRTLELVDTSVYAIDRWRMTENFTFEAGLQWNQNDYTDETFINPRVAAEWAAWPQATITTSAGRYNRIPDIGTILPEYGNPELKSPTADHYTLGLKGEAGVYWDWSVELYHKELQKLPLALGGDQPDAELLYSNDVEGTAQGVDLFLNRERANGWYGWVALSYSTSRRTNNRTAETRDYYLDTPMVLNVVGNYQFTEKWNAGFRLTAKSGQATTKIIGVRSNPDAPDRYLPVYGEPYQDRLPIYARLDLRIAREIGWFGKEGSIFMDILNATNRRNIDAIGLDYGKVEETGELFTEKEVGLGIFPSIGISLTF